MVALDLAPEKQIFKNMGLTDDTGTALFLRVQLLKAVKAEIQKNNWTQNEAAQKLGVKQPRISEIYGLRIDKFTVELLVKYLQRLGKEVNFNIRNARR
jgi:predicted XRE-type DNA-binding protein